MSKLTKKIEELSAIIPNSTFAPGYTPLDITTVLDKDELDELKTVAKFVGVDLKEAGHTFGVSNNNTEYAPRLARPVIASNGQTLCFKWGEAVTPVNPELASDCSIQITGTNDNKMFSLSVDIPYADDIISFDFPMSMNKGVDSLPSRGVIFKILATGKTHAGMKDLLSKFRRQDPIRKLSELDDGTYNAIASEPITTAAGKVIPILEIEDIGRFWSLNDLTLPCEFVKNDNTLIANGEEYGLSTFTKLRDLDVGVYKIVGYSWGTMTYEGGSKTIATLELDDARKVGANARIESLLKNSCPEISAEHPATLFIDSKSKTSDNKVKVNCRLVPTKLSGAMAAIAQLAVKAEEEAELIPF